MKKIRTSSLLVTCFVIPIITLSAKERPNILFLFCDDLGYGDIGVFYQNSRDDSQPRIKTPHLDGLAKSGMQVRAHYVGAPVCAPSRATLFLGMGQGNSPIRDNQFDKALPDQPTLASTLQQAGYHTGLVGKWGLQGHVKDKASMTPKGWPSYPTKRGFDYYLGSVAHRDGHEHYPYNRVHFKTRADPVPLWEQDVDISSQLQGCYSTDLFTAASKKFLMEHSSSSQDKPFFLMLSYDTPHAATQVATMPYPKGFGLIGGVQWLGEPGAVINTVSGKVDGFIHPDYRNKPWKDVSKRYASSIRRIDNSVADLVQTLKDLKMYHNTLIIFSSDHGPSRESYIQQALKPDFFQSFGPFTGIKRDCWEGGIRPGAIASWPSKIKAGSITEVPSQMQDWMPTFCDLAGTNTPASSDGVSLLPTLTGEGKQQDSTIYVEYHVKGITPRYKQFPKSRAGQQRGQMQCIRIGNLKAVRYNIETANAPFLVFDLIKDPSESTNIAGKVGVPDQQYWLDQVSRLHHANSSAKRPYDDLLIAAIKPSGLNSGERIQPMKRGVTQSYLSRDHFRCTGYIKVDEAGKYTFSFPVGVKGLLRIHKINILDTASKEAYPNSNTLHLARGYHPFSLYLEKEATASQTIQWRNQGAKKATYIPADRFFH